MDSMRISPEIGAESAIEALLRTIRKRRREIALWTMAGLAAASCYLLLRTPLYEASAMVESRTPNERFLRVSEVEPVDEPLAASARSEMDTAVRVLSSRELRESAAESLKIRGSDALRDERLEQLVRETAAERREESRIIEIAARSADAVLAADFVNALVAQFVGRGERERRETAGKTQAWIDERLNSYRAKLEESEQRLQQLAVDSGLATISPDRLQASEQRLGRIEAELSLVRTVKLDRLARVESVESGTDTLPEGADFSLLREYLARRADLQREYARLDALFTPAQHQVQQAAAELEQIDQAISVERARLKAQAENDYRTAALREEMLESEHQRELGLATEQARTAIASRILEGEVEANRRLYEEFLDRNRQAGVAAGAPESTIQVVDRAVAADRPAGPSTAEMLAAGLLCGAFFGILWAGVREGLDRTIQRPGEMALRLDVRELGVIPDGLEAPESRMTPAVGAPALDRRVELVSSQMPRSLPAECIRSVRTALLGGGDTAEPPRTIVVTSAAAGEGKTTVAANLAISLAEVDRRVLLIDADLRRPRLHRVFGIDNRLGLSDLLNESGVQARLDQALVPVEGVAGLWLLPSGVSAYGGPGLLHSAQARELLNRLGERFDRVVIDAPPAAAVSDARALARWADGALLVARAASVDLREVADTVTLLRADGAVILGAVLNRWDPKRLGYRRYGPYAAYSPGAGRAKRAATA